MVLIVDPFCYVCLMLFSVMLLFSVPCCLVLTCLEKIDITALLCVVLSCVYVTFLLWSILKNAFGESMETGIAKIGRFQNSDEKDYHFYNGTQNRGAMLRCVSHFHSDS